MTAFEHCHICKPPTRYPGCHSECPYYQEDLAKTKEYAAQKEAEYHAGDDFFDRTRIQDAARAGYEETKKMKWRPVYMKIDYAHAGIPEYIADSPTELAALCGVGLSTISHSLAT